MGYWLRDAPDSWPARPGERVLSPAVFATLGTKLQVSAMLQ